MLEHFSDWKRTALTLYYSSATYNPNTGKVEKGYKIRGEIKAFVYQSSAMQGLVSDKIIDQSDFVGVYEQAVDTSDVAEIDGVFYELVGVDNVMFQDSVWTFGLKRTEMPDILTTFTVWGDKYVLGDAKGVLGDRES